MHQFLHKFGIQRFLSQSDLNSSPLLEIPTTSSRRSGHHRPAETTQRSAVDAAPPVSEPSSTVVLYSKDDDKVKTPFLPSSPSSTTSPSSTGTAETQTMPTKTSSKANQTGEMFNGLDNCYDVVGHENSKDFDVYSLSNVPKSDPNHRNNLDTSAAVAATITSTTTASASTTTASPRSEASDNVEVIGDHKDNDAVSVLYKKKANHRNHNNNHQQGDINSIESISENNFEPLKRFKPSHSDLSWIDELYEEYALRNNGSTLPLNKQKKKSVRKEELDQLDGVPSKSDIIETPPEEKDEKVVKCLYYSLMCCECTIS